MVTFLVALLSSVLSGVASGGGGFVMAPYWLLIGMTPAQGVASGSFMALGMTISSLAAFKGSGHYPRNKTLVLVLLGVATLASILGAVLLPKIDITNYKLILGLVTVASVPLLFIRPFKNHQAWQNKKLGYSICALLLVFGSIIMTSTFSILLAIALMSFFRMSIYQMTALRRLIGVIQTLVLFTGLALQGNFLWQHSVAAILGGVFGSYIGTKYAIKKGEDFAKYLLAIMSVVGAVVLMA